MTTGLTGMVYNAVSQPASHLSVLAHTNLDLLPLARVPLQISARTRTLLQFSIRTDPGT